MLRRWPVIVILWILLAPLSEAQQPDSGGIELFVADGQLMSHPFRVFLTHDITPEMQPRLSLHASHTFSTAQKGERDEIKPLVIARNQISTETVASQKIQMTGTLLLFDLQNYPVPPYKGMIRLTPILTWTESTPAGPLQRTVVAAHEINLGNIGVAAAWALAIVGLFVALIALLARRTGHSIITFFCGNDGRLSLSRTQVALWTLAIGVVVGGYGLLKLEVPDIPETLVVLMGMSLATGGISYVKGDRKVPASAQALQTAPASAIKPRFCDLVCAVDENGQEHLSLARAQMLFWTGLTVVLFMIKSVLDGVLWDVPWEMVALMGMSQAAYLSPKLVPQQ
ncbi:MAG: hypothetical protein ACOY4D_08995 [Pseudomonadota bacterium]